MPIRVVLADDHAMIRQGLKAILEAEGFQVPGEASNGIEAVELTQKLRPDIVVLDISMRFAIPSWATLIRVGLMVGVIAAVGLAFWSPLSSEIHSHTERITKAYARSLQTDVLDEVRHQVLAQVRFAELLATEPRIPTGLWESQARLFLTHHAGYVAVQWIDENGLTLGNVSADGNRAQRSPVSQEELQNLLHDLRRDCREDAKFTSPAHLANGNTSRDVVVPICRNQQSLGVLLATIDESRLLTQILEDDVGLGYGIATYDGNEQIFITPSVGSNDSKRWAQQAPVDLPGAPWRIIVWPESVMLQQINSRLPEVALLTGSLIGLLLFTTLDFARTSYFRSQELRRAHDPMFSGPCLCRDPLTLTRNSPAADNVWQCFRSPVSRRQCDLQWVNKLSDYRALFRAGNSGIVVERGSDDLERVRAAFG